MSPKARWWRRPPRPAQPDHGVVPDRGAVHNTIGGGLFLHAVIQGRDITVRLPPRITPALSGLPLASPQFTGRDSELGRLLDGLAPRRDQELPVPVAAVAGLAGIGKTELVVQAAAVALKRPSWFPGGVLFTDLHGYDPDRRVSPERALDGLLRALAVPGEHVPPDLEGRRRLYRSVLAAYAKERRRILVVVDNASTADEVRPLLPTDGTTAVLVTSRHTLDIGARLHDLETLDEDASADLITGHLHRARGDEDTRPAGDPHAVRAIARLCAGLPLALRIAAALLADPGAPSPAELAAALEDERTRLDELEREEVAVRAVFDLSYHRLGAAHARLFRLLPLNPGTDLSTESAVHLAAIEERRTGRLLRDLARAHLIEAGSAPGRWRMHDLVRLHADEHGRACAEEDGRDTARIRLFEHYRTTAEAAVARMVSGPDGSATRFPDRTAAVAWLDEERDSLIATVGTAHRRGRPGTSTALARSLSRYLEHSRAFGDWATVTGIARALHHEAGDRHAEGTMLNSLGRALRGARRFEEAVEAHTRAVHIHQELDDRRCEAWSFTNLGRALRESRRFEEAIDAHTRAMDIHGAQGDRPGEGTALDNIGIALQGLRRFDEAIDAHTRAADICREAGERHDEAWALTNLGLALQGARRFEEAIAAHRRAAGMHGELGDRHSEGAAQDNLATAWQELRRFGEAAAAHTRAADIFRETGDLHSEGMAWNNLGLALQGLRRYEEAIDAHGRAAAINRDTGDRHGEATASVNTGNALQEVRRFREAAHSLAEAAETFREVGDPHGRATALDSLGCALRRLRRFEEAVEAHTRARDIHRASDDRYAEAAASHNLGLALREARRPDDAVAAHTRAVEISREIGDRHGEANAWGGLGRALWKAGRTGEAIGAFARSVATARTSGADTAEN
jgi:tetratricopeptide (TPR) repeat protein